MKSWLQMKRPIIGCLRLLLHPPLVCVLNIVWLKEEKLLGGFSTAFVDILTHVLVNYLREEALLSQKDFIDNKCCTSNFDPCSLVSCICARIGHRVGRLKCIVRILLLHISFHLSKT